MKQLMSELNIFSIFCKKEVIIKNKNKFSHYNLASTIAQWNL